MERAAKDTQALAEPAQNGPASGLANNAEPLPMLDALPEDLAGLDFGTYTGVCINKPGQPFQSQTLCLACEEELEQQRREGKERTLDVRFARFFNFILELVKLGARRFVFEDVGFGSTRMQTQLWASLRSALWAAALLHPELRIFCVPVATLKQFATGSSKAKKRDMAKALAQRHPEDYKLSADGERILKTDGTLADHNEVDAIWIALYAEAVERGERSFLSVHQRKQLKAEELRRKRAVRRGQTRVKRTAQAAVEKAKQRALRFALKSLGTCCGVLRKRDRHLAVCPKCGGRIALPKIQISAGPAKPEEIPVAKGASVVTAQPTELRGAISPHQARYGSARPDQLPRHCTEGHPTLRPHKLISKH